MTPAAVYVDQIRADLGPAWLPRLYRERILKMRTRSYQFPPLPRKTDPAIHHTLLGVELKAGRRRMLCPDLATARYLAVFARIGCRAVAIPYDITRISFAADELESSWHRMLLLTQTAAADRKAPFRARLRHQLIAKVREEIDEAGAGAARPQFNQSTRQKLRAAAKTAKGNS